MLMWLSAFGDSHGGGANTNQHPCICACPSWEDLGTVCTPWKEVPEGVSLGELSLLCLC